jgi:hypothetical protein
MGLQAFLPFYAFGSGEVKDRYDTKDEAPPLSPAAAKGCGQCIAAEEASPRAEIPSGEAKRDDPSQVSGKKEGFVDVQSNKKSEQASDTPRRLSDLQSLDLDDYWL